MFCVVYQFEVPSQNEAAFKAIWRELTLVIKETRGGLGSRLHQDSNRANTWIAYAQWPNKETWSTNAPFTNPLHTELQIRLVELCTSVGIIYELEVVDDLLTLPNHS